MLRAASNSLLLAAALAIAFGGAAVPAKAQVSPAAPNGQPVVLDSVVAVINGDVILESDVREEMRFVILQPDRADPARNTQQSALRRLIDRDLILQQMKATQARTPQPTAEQVNKQIDELRRQIPECAQYNCETQAGWDAFIAAHGLTEPEIEAHWRQRMMILAFIQSRFGAGVRISEADIQEYYEKNLAPEFIKRKLKPPPLETVSARIQEILLQQQVNTLLQDWLQSLKTEGNVSILGAAYADVGSPEGGGPKP
jgi:peptidyl-prolyl cis-trans isomerase SurA